MLEMQGDLGLLALLGGGLDPNIPDNDGLSPLHHAVISNRRLNIAALLRCGALVNAQDLAGWTPLHHCACLLVADRDTARLLLENGAQPALKTAKGQTAADIALHFRNHALGAFLQDALRAAL